MSFVRNRANHYLRHLGPRAFWLLLVLIHIPALIGATKSLLATPDFFHIASLIALIITVACFVLKLGGYRFIKQGNARNQALVFLVIASLVHHEAAISSVENLLASPAPALAAVLIIAETLRRTRKHLPNLRRRLAALLRTYLSPACLVGFTSEFDLFAPGTKYASSPASPRAPPA